jgi:hypothetical protein
MSSEDNKISKSNSLFLNNMEKWIDGIIIQDGLADAQIVKKIKESFTRAMQANIEYHTLLAKSSDDKGKQDRHELMVKIYNELLS